MTFFTKKSEDSLNRYQLCLFADRTSTYQMSSNQLRLWFSAVAYVLMNELRRRYLKGTQLAQAQCSTIRLKLFKIGALITVSVRRIYIQMSSTYPYKDMFHKIMLNLKSMSIFSVKFQKGNSLFTRPLFVFQ